MPIIGLAGKAPASSVADLFLCFQVPVNVQTGLPPKFIRGARSPVSRAKQDLTRRSANAVFSRRLSLKVEIERAFRMGTRQ